MDFKGRYEDRYKVISHVIIYVSHTWIPQFCGSFINIVHSVLDLGKGTFIQV